MKDFGKNILFMGGFVFTVVVGSVIEGSEKIGRAVRSLFGKKTKKQKPSLEEMFPKIDPPIYRYPK